MKINQVEELTGISKKNIRFYESEGLITPKRDPANGYRSYSLEDVSELDRIRLLRKLDVPCEKIRQMQKGELSLAGCMEDHLLSLSRRQRDLTHIQEICERIAKDRPELSGLDASAYLDEMKQLEKGGVHFMDTKETDVRKRRNGAIIAAVVCIGFFLLLLTGIFFANREDPIPLAAFLLITGIIVAMILGIILALRQRLGEVRKGEIDEASKY